MNLPTSFQRPQHNLTHSEGSSVDWLRIVLYIKHIAFILMSPALQWVDTECKQSFLQPLVSEMCVQLAAFMNTLLYTY